MRTSGPVGTIPRGNQARPAIREHPSRTWSSGPTSSGATPKNDRRRHRRTPIYRASRNRREIACRWTAEAGNVAKTRAGQGPRHGLEHVLGRNTAPSSPSTPHHVWRTEIRTREASLRAQPAENYWDPHDGGPLNTARPSVACSGPQAGDRKRCAIWFERCISRAQLCTYSSAATLPGWLQGRIIRDWASNK